MAVMGPIDPRALLSILHRIEAELGRERRERWGARVIDLDLIACGDLVLPDTAAWANWADLALEDQMTNAPDELILPHPRMQDRGFVLVPLVHVAPDWVHPVLGKSVQALHDALSADQIAEVRQIADAPLLE